MSDWNGEDPIKAGMRLSYRRGKLFIRKAIVLYISDFFIIVSDEDKTEEVGFPRSDRDEFSVVETDRDIAIKQMAEITGKQAPQFLKYYGKIYDGGFRKIE